MWKENLLKEKTQLCLQYIHKKFPTKGKMRNIEGGRQSQKSLEISRSLQKSLDLILKVFQEEK